MKRIAIITPSRGRPEGLKRFIDSVVETTTECDLVFAFQSDDEHLMENIAISKEYGTHFVVDNIGIISKLNIMTEFSPGYEFYTIGSDDVVLLTKDWDQKVLNSAETMSKELGHKHLVLYGDDGIHGVNLCTHPIISKEFIASTGWFYPPGYMRHLYADNAIGMIAGAVGCLAYIDSIKIDHRHYINGKAEMDDNYKETNSPDAYFRDRASFDEWVNIEADKIINKLKEDIKQ